MTDSANNFDLSIILPFYKKMKDFKRVLPHNASFFQRNGIEVIICLDEPTEGEALLEYIKHYPLINWRIIVNENDHEWRNPAKPLNVGIRHSLKKYIMVMSPECEFYSDVIDQLFKAATQHDRGFFVGRVAFSDYSFDRTTDVLTDIPLVYYGSILTKRSYFEEVSGYTESYRIWGGEDDNIRAKLEKKGIAKFEIEEAILLHREDEGGGYERRVEQNSTLPETVINKSFTPDEDDYKGTSEWGRDFNSVKFDYKHSQSVTG